MPHIGSRTFLEPASLARAARGAFTSRSVRLGRGYFEEARVTLEGADEQVATASVRGTRPLPYRVAVRYQDVASRGRLEISCTCPYFAEGFPCKHLYATLLALDASGAELVHPAYLEGRIDVVSSRPELEPGEDDFFLDEGEQAPSDDDWRRRFARARRATAGVGAPPGSEGLDPIYSRPVVYLVDPTRSEATDALVVEAWSRDASGTLKPLTVDPVRAHLFEMEADTRALALLTVARSPSPEKTVVARILAPHEATVLEALLRTGRFFIGGSESEPRAPLRADDGPPLTLTMREVLGPAEVEYRLDLHQGGQPMRAEAVQVALSSGLVIIDNRITRLTTSSGVGWLRHQRSTTLLAPRAARPDAIAELAESAELPPLRLCPPWVSCLGRPRLRIDWEGPNPRKRQVVGHLRVQYGRAVYGPSDRASAHVQRAEHVVVQREPDAERVLISTLRRMGVRPVEGSTAGEVSVSASDWDRVVSQMVLGGASVTVPGRKFVAAGLQTLRIQTQQDWFELDGWVEFDGEQVAVPDLLAALRRSDKFVTLADGREGVLPAGWAERFTALARLSTSRSKTARFSKEQALVLELLLDESVERDAAFQQRAGQLEAFSQIAAEPEPESFAGALRPYQQEGLGWLLVLEKVGLGGCLADDMGLGKTVQVLALLAARKAAGRAQGPSLIVAPRSLIHNWIEEAERFVPSLRVARYTGADRHTLWKENVAYDALITTYGTIRRDASLLADKAFDYIVLDEAQAIKNPNALASRACRGLSARQRLALTGTPVENHLGELWAIFEFLNRGMLGNARGFATLARPENHASLERVAQGLAPLVLRRTKDQVLNDLPSKTESVLSCEMETDEKRRYDELFDFLRAQVATQGGNRSSGARAEVLKALLRLRQAACHPGLIDERRRASDSAKLTCLLEQLEEVIDAGHRALVFSQFVGFLSILRERLGALNINYAYLDGSTQDREGAIRRFSEDPDCRVFLMSLKAGGLGLNLTSADYVYLCDPWWNPAVEQQAIDRAHRIGQTRPVFAYRVIVRGTVEEKIRALHAKKLALAESVVGTTNTPGGWSLDELRALLLG